MKANFNSTVRLFLLAWVGLTLIVAQVKLEPAAERIVKVRRGGSPTPAQLAEAIRTLPRQRILAEQESELIAEGQSSRIVQAGILDSEGSLSNARLTPPLSAPELDSLTGDNDPQIAVGHEWYVVSGYNRVVFYKKGETHRTTPGAGLPANPITTRDLFAWLISPMNPQNANYQLAGMGVPTQDCDPTGQANTHLCINDIYDLRVRYDRVGKHFFILAHTRAVSPGTATESEKLKRRSFNFLAVSNAEDPHEGFHYFFWPEVIDEGICSVVTLCPPNTPYTPGQAADYPTFTVNDPYLVEADNVKGPKGYQILHLIPLAPLRDVSGAQSSEIKTTTKGNLKGASGKVVVGGLRPVEQLSKHGKRQYLVRTRREDNGDEGLEIFWFNPNQQDPFALHTAFVKTKPFGAVRNDPAMPGTTRLLSFSNVGNSVINAVVRDEKLWAVFDDCRVWSGASQCVSAIRLVEIDLSGPQPELIKDRTFGKHSADDKSDDPIVGYGNPGVMVTSKGDAVVVYNRSSAKVYPEVRYSVWFHNEPDIRPSHILRQGNASAPPSADKPTAWNIDTAGIAIDPADETVVWMAHDCATNPEKPILRMAVGMLKLP